MGIKENFSQAVRELTGAGKEEKRNDNKSTVDGMRNAVAADDTSEFMAVSEPAPDPAPIVDEFEEIERRAAMAAENLNRQQNAFTQGEFNANQAAQAQPMAAAPQQFAQQPQPVQQPQQQFAQPQQPFSQQPQQQFSQQQYAQQFAQAPFTQTPPPYFTQSAGGQTPPPVTPPPVVHQEPSSFSTAPYHSQADDNETTVISKNTVIDGNIRSFANMSIDGNVKGNVETTKDIDINGKIVGNIACNNASLRTSQIQGNIQMKGNAFMERDTLLIGDLTSTYANVNGKIKGNLATTGKTELKSDAVVFGDISASTITVDDGAIIQGYVSTTFLNKEESKNIFPDAITIGD